MKRVREFFWPVLDPITRSADEQAKEDRGGELVAIRSTIWKLPEAMEHARQLTAAENERKQGAETKASLYLAVIAAMVPILGSLVTDFFQQVPSSPRDAFGTITLAIFVLGMAYLLACGVWSFRTLKVSVYSRVDVSELLQAAASPDPEQHLVKEMLCAVRTNRDEVNAKITRIRMAHLFLIRTFLTFSLLLMVIVLWKSAAASLEGAAALGSEAWKTFGG
ncbi:hypothetical protein LB545_01285 [Mesorhizobium sp. BR1-1-6]|uniref:hypothetical protein n=1 Tax=Mesorhizobium sp. BR1-1-6 TaxID=2876648 RepID=UPI001CD04FD3|nr:hypothetical protein [Mesorhizobium sp. BR1-1-6]MBZ9892958.1 hypothetical protein [Mesorhizobium sp. BR1-1-6]